MELFQKKPEKIQIQHIGVAKLAAGQMSRILANQINIIHIWPRIVSCYGPYDYKKTMVIDSIKTMLEKNVSPKLTKAQQQWDYIYSKDIAKAYYLIAEKGKNNETYCIAQGEHNKLSNYIEIIKNKINPNIKLKFGEIPYVNGKIINLAVDISKLKADTGFEPDYNFEKGIEETINWYKKEILERNE